MAGVKHRFLLIRGLLRETRHWGSFPCLLQKHFPGAAIQALDIPGNGKLHRLTSPDCIPAMTEALREQVDVRQPLDLVALSMGGMIALDWMTRYPDEISSAVLINTSVRPSAPFYQRLRWQSWPAIMRMLCRGKSAWEQGILELTSNRHGQCGALLETWLQWRRQRPVSGRSAVNQLLAAAQFRITAHPRQPILVVASKADRLVDYRCSLQMHKAWRTQYRQHDTAGHDLPLDEPQWLLHVIEQWYAARLS